MFASQRKVLFAIVLSFLLALFGCGGSAKGTNSTPPPPKLVSIAITPGTQTIAPSTEQQFIATGTYSDNSTQNITGSVTWSSSNTGVATIGNASPTNGLVIAVAKGSATINATSGTISGTATINVTSAIATALTISGPTSMAIDVSQQFTVKATFSDATTQEVTNVAKWASTSSSVATITVSGLVTAKTIGSTTISASFESVSSNTLLTVNASNLTSITINTAINKSTIAQGTNTLLIATGTFNNGSTDNLSSRVAWVSSDTSIAIFNSSNQISGLKPGTVTITAALGSVSGNFQLTVSSATIIGNITVTPVNQTIPIGWHQKFTATGSFSDGSTQDISNSVQWTSDNSAVAAVGGGTGLVLGNSQGNANITAAFSFAGASATGTTPLAVSSATLSSIAVSSASGKTLVAPGSTLQMNAKGTWSDSSSQNLNAYANWSSSDTTVATIAAGGAVIGQSTGNTTITATYGGRSATLDLVVEGFSLVSINITPTNLELPSTIETQLTATGTFADGNQLNLSSAVTWTSSTPSVATVSNSANNPGVATGIATGTSTVTATFAGMSTNTTLTVTNATLTGIAVSPVNSSISLGASQQFTAQGTFTDNNPPVNITVQTVWSSTNVSVATINSSGIASSASSGTTTISATLDGVTGMTTLTVQ